MLWSGTSTRNKMVQYSIKYSDKLFILTGIGEEEGDYWREYYFAGRVQTCKGEITFSPFDEDLLI